MIKTSHGKRYPLILNPKARSEKADGARRFIMDHAGRFAIFASNSAEEAEELAAIFAASEEPVVVAAGGDGTLNAVVKGLSGKKTALGILPTGTMNVFARELGLPVDQLKRAFEVIDKGETVDVDLFSMNGAPFVQMAGVGFDAQVIEETKWEAKKALGPLAYLVSAMKVLGDTPPKMTVHFDEGHVEEGVAVLVGNGSLYGGQVRLFGKADNADDLLDVLIFKESGYKVVTDTLAGLARGGFDENMDTVGYYQSSGLRVECDRDIPVEVDGELWGKTRVAVFENIPEKLKVLAPKDAAMPKWEEMLRALSPWTPNK
ncbi:diacylglycerol/lipid kinase family protein [Roseibacillus persicicus]|uniref:Diacylglycerol kinase n=1 Tax=Roseibacillus persicicus TaxID=454148 RepID=A0A918TKK1_9BACT|nr:diacylglycerol kinase family protein [Roseibacillus persicicus]MDQ8189947.1 diacylglycerol kinase family lipid kinase [Roseibacillus persicicus]GHC51291.1 diacylglycerol kinase [Roseibacillus persicicus]